MRDRAADARLGHARGRTGGAIVAVLRDPPPAGSGPGRRSRRVTRSEADTQAHGSEGTIPDAKVSDYASALLALARAAGATGRLESDLSACLTVFAQHPEIGRFLSDPAVRDRGKEAAVEELLGDRIHPALLHFLLVLAAQGDIVLLHEVAEQFFVTLSAREEKAAGEILSAFPLADETVRRIEETVAACGAGDVRLRVRIDSNLLGGIIVRVGSRVWDGSIERRLQQAGRSLAE